MTIEPIASSPCSRTNPSTLTLLAVFVLSTGCPSAAQQASVYLDQNHVPLELKQDFECFAVNCSKCHSLARALNAPIASTEHWDRYVARMARNPGSGISPKEAPSILRFLHWHTLEARGIGREQNGEPVAHGGARGAAREQREEARP